MASSLLRPAVSMSPEESLKLAQQAPDILRKNPKAFSASPLSSLFSIPETAEVWTIYENLMLACLRTGDDSAAKECLERITLRFGPKHERVLALQGLVREATTSNHSELEKLLEEYDLLLSENGTNIPVFKRKVALLRSMGKIPEATSALNALVDISPTDSEAWAELADIYVSQGLYPQATYALEEVLALSPNAWNVHARLGEILLMAVNTSSEGAPPQKYLAEAVKRFCRSIELCNDYLRGYYGLKMATDKALATAIKSKKQHDQDGFLLPDQTTLEKLNEAATKKLAEIVRRNGAGEESWQGYAAGEIAAARDVLNQSGATLTR